MLLNGKLGEIGLADIVQLLGELHRTGQLHLVGSGSTTGELTFDQGKLVDASFGASRGLEAVRACSQALGQAEFSFTETEPTGDHTVELSPDQLSAYLTTAPPGPNGSTAPEQASPPLGDEQSLVNAAMAGYVARNGACPKLGLADEPDRHYSRVTALHRCYANGGPSLVATDEQRTLCLGGEYAACPRLLGNGTVLAPGPRAAEGASSPTVPARPNGAAPAQLIPPVPVAAPARPRRRRLPRGALLLAMGAVVVLLAFNVLKPPTIGSLPTVMLGIAAAPAHLQSTEPAPTAAPEANPTPVEVPGAGTAATPVPGPRGLAFTAQFSKAPGEPWISNPPYAQWSDGAYRFSARDTSRFVALGAPLETNLTDVLVSGTFHKTGGPPGGGYGMLLRAQADSPLDGTNQSFTGYVLEVGDQGQVGIWRRDGDRWIDLVPWTPSGAVHKDLAPNKVVARSVSDLLSLSVNDVQVAEIRDGTLKVGGVGVFVGGDGNQVALDEFAVQTP